MDAINSAALLLTANAETLQDLIHQLKYNQQKNMRD